MAKKVISKNISLYPEDWQAVRETERSGMNTSQGVRYIIREWLRLRQNDDPCGDSASQPTH